jgi:hypothetical protein
LEEQQLLFQSSFLHNKLELAKEVQIQPTLQKETYQWGTAVIATISHANVSLGWR